MVTCNQVNVEVKHVATLDDLDVVAVVLELIPPTEVGIAVVVLVSLFHCVLYRPGDIFRGCVSRGTLYKGTRFTDLSRARLLRLIHMLPRGQDLSTIS